MKDYNSLKGIFLCLCVSGCLLPSFTIAQNKTQYSSLEEAMRTGRKLAGKPGSARCRLDKQWRPVLLSITQGGISSKDPATLKERCYLQ